MNRRQFLKTGLFAAAGWLFKGVRAEKKPGPPAQDVEWVQGMDFAGGEAYTAVVLQNNSVGLREMGIMLLECFDRWAKIQRCDPLLAFKTRMAIAEQCGLMDGRAMRWLTPNDDPEIDRIWLDGERVEDRCFGFYGPAQEGVCGQGTAFLGKLRDGAMYLEPDPAYPGERMIAVEKCSGLIRWQRGDSI